MGALREKIKRDVVEQEFWRQHDCSSGMEGMPTNGSLFPKYRVKFLECREYIVAKAQRMREKGREYFVPWKCFGEFIQEHVEIGKSIKVKTFFFLRCSSPLFRHRIIQLLNLPRFVCNYSFCNLNFVEKGARKGCRFFVINCSRTKFVAIIVNVLVFFMQIFCWKFCAFLLERSLNSHDFFTLSFFIFG